MVPFIHCDLKIIKELNFILDKNSIKYLISFHKKNLNNLFFKKEHFYYACSKNNLNIIKYIFNNLHNKKIDFIEALNSSTKQYNLKLINWLSGFYKFTKEDYYYSLKHCINNENLKLFKKIVYDHNLDLSCNNYDILLHSIKNNKCKILKFILSIINNINYSNDMIKYSYLSNNNKILKIIINKENKYQGNIFDILNNVIKLGYTNSFNYLLNFEIVVDYIKINIYKIIYISFESCCLEIIKKILSLNYHNDINYNYLYKKTVIYGNLDIIKFIYEIDDTINVYEYLSFEKIIKNKFYEILIFLIEKNPIISSSYSHFTQLKMLINEYYLKIVLNINKSELVLFLKFLKNNNINASFSNTFYLINNLLSYNQIDKIEVIKDYYPEYLCYSESTLISDSIKSHNYECIKYACNLIKQNIDDYKYEILYYSYVHGLINIINELDSDNNFELQSYEIPMIKNILRNDNEIIKRLINKYKKLNKVIDYDMLDIIIKMGNSEILKLMIPILDNNILNINQSNIDECIYNNNFELIKILQKKTDLSTFINGDLFLKICKYGNLNFMKWFLEHNINIDNYINSAFNTLIIYENYDQAIFYYNIKNNNKYIDLTSNNFFIIKEIIKKNDFEMFIWVLNNFNDLNQIQFIIYLELQENIIQLIKYDNYQILKYVIKKYKLNNNNTIKKLYTYCFKEYKFNSLNYLSENFELKNYDLNLDFKSIFLNCIKLKKYNIIDIIIKNVQNYSWLNILSYYETDDNILEYLIKNYYNYLNINEDLFYNILYTGNLEYLKLFIKYYRDDLDYNNIKEDDYLILVGYNDTELLDFIYSLNSNVCFDNNDYILKLIIKLNKYKVLKWFLNKFKFDNFHEEDYDLYYHCIVNKNIHMIQLLYEYDDKEKFNEYKLRYLKIASQIKDLNIFIWFENNFDNLDLSIENNVLINNSLISNNIVVFKYIINKINIDINYEDGLIIRTAFGNNLNEIIKFLFSKFHNIDVFVKNQIIMKYAIEDGDLDMINLLYNYNNNFDLSIDNEYLFRISCKMDHINVVKWLMNNKHDINYSINNHEIFYYVCNHNYSDIALYFTELNSELYEIKIENGEISSFEVKKQIIIDGELEVNNIERCPICLDNDSKLITDCNHQFCEDCLKKLNNKSEILNCPLCRNTINNIKRFKILDSEN